MSSNTSSFVFKRVQDKGEGAVISLWSIFNEDLSRPTSAIGHMQGNGQATYVRSDEKIRLKALIGRPPMFDFTSSITFVLYMW